MSDQYLPPHFVEDKSMPAERAVQLLQEWKEEQPQLSYADNKQANACAVLMGNNNLTTEVRDKHLAILRQEL